MIYDITREYNSNDNLIIIISAVITSMVVLVETILFRVCNKNQNIKAEAKILKRPESV